ncbi:LysE family translocator [uncultured Shewanella sp.]|uniref:LysE family translocator n=1 Tax=uncultured Shewanella sp. TaxID=173975 RepID=UPI0026359255|nr:LysE family translocator [uncultured Shewanella sp.]
MIEAVITLITTTALLLGSPGPAPLALAATGATHGIKKGTPFLCGILLGLSVAIVGTTMGLASLFAHWPELQITVQLLGAAYLVYIAFKIATAPVSPNVNASSVNAPLLKDGFILNLLNPKAYAAFLAIFSQFILPLTSEIHSYIATGIICLAVAAIVDTLWLCFGGLLRPLFQHPRQARILRILFAILMIFALVWALIR